MIRELVRTDVLDFKLEMTAIQPPCKIIFTLFFFFLLEIYFTVFVITQSYFQNKYQNQFAKWKLQLTAKDLMWHRGQREDTSEGRMDVWRSVTQKKAPSSNTRGKRAPQVTWESEDLTGPQCALCLRGPCVSACVNGGLVSSWPSTMQTMHAVNGYEEMDDASEHKALGGVKPTNPAFFPFSAANAW